MKAKSIRTFIGAKDFETSRKFYRELGFQENPLNPNMSYFHVDKLGFYLQAAYVKDWIDNSMIFIEVENTVQFYQNVQDLNLSEKFENVRLIPIREEHWGKEFFLHDPSGVLWHFGEFYNSEK